ncbi:MAG: hypothetical protein IPJ84_15105 [Bdellovibrionales bacterium]|nr:hypothetical protein [Bdellovibrionales bacterium]
MLKQIYLSIFIWAVSNSSYAKNDSSCAALFKKGDELGASICIVKKICADCRLNKKSPSNIRVIQSQDGIGEIEVINQTKAHVGDIEFTGGFRLSSIYQNEDAQEITFMKNASYSTNGIPIKHDRLSLSPRFGRSRPVAFPSLLLKMVDKKKISIQDIEPTASLPDNWVVITVIAEKQLTVCGINLPIGSQIGVNPLSSDGELQAAPTGPVTVDDTVYEPGTHVLQLTDRTKCNVRIFEAMEDSRSWRKP